MFTLLHCADKISKTIFCALLQGSPPSFVSDLFCDLRDGSKLLDLLEVMSGQMMVSFNISEMNKFQFSPYVKTTIGKIKWHNWYWELSATVIIEKTKRSWGFPAEGQYWDGIKISQEKKCTFAHWKTLQYNICVSVVCLMLLPLLFGVLQVKLVNINIPDIIDGRPSIILGLVWTVILHCHVSTVEWSITQILMAGHLNKTC